MLWRVRMWNFQSRFFSFPFHPIRDLCSSLRIILLILHNLVALFLNSRFGIPHFLSFQPPQNPPEFSVDHLW